MRAEAAAPMGLSDVEVTRAYDRSRSNLWAGQAAMAGVTHQPEHEGVSCSAGAGALMTYRRRTPAASEGTRALARSPSRRRHALETRSAPAEQETDAVLPA